MVALPDVRVHRTRRSRTGQKEGTGICPRYDNLHLCRRFNLSQIKSNLHRLLYQRLRLAVAVSQILLRTARAAYETELLAKRRIRTVNDGVGKTAVAAIAARASASSPKVSGKQVVTIVR